MKFEDLAKKVTTLLDIGWELVGSARYSPQGAGIYFQTLLFKNRNW